MYCESCGMPLAYGMTKCSVCNHENNHEEPKKSKKGLIIGLIIAAVVLVPIIILGLVFVVGVKNTSSMISDSKTKSAISYYDTVKRQVMVKDAMGDSIICDDNCNYYFDIQSEYFEIEVEPYGNDYKLTLEFNDSFLGNNILDKNICSSRDLTCDDDEISGIISLTE